MAKIETMNNKFVILLLAFLSTTVACEEECESEIIEYNISQQTNDWLPHQCFEENSKFVFQTEDGEIKEYRKTEKGANFRQELDGTFGKTCENGEKNHIDVYYERLGYYFFANDRSWLNFGTFIQTKTCSLGGKHNNQFFESLYVSMYDYPSREDLGFITIETNLLNSDKITEWCGNEFTFYESIKIAGHTYRNVYAKDTARTYILGNIFFTKEQGLVGYIDAKKKEWRLVE